MIIFKGDKLLVRIGKTPESHSPSDLLELGLQITGSSAGLPEVWGDLPPWSEVSDTSDVSGVSSEFEWIDLREVGRRWGDEVFARASAAYQYMN